MNPDDDLAKLLPEAPPRPDRREASIAEAMRRFDGEKPTVTNERRGPRWSRPSWLNIGRVQMGALMSMGILAVVGVPLALMVAREQAPEGPQAEPIGAINPQYAQKSPASPSKPAGRAEAKEDPAASRIASREAGQAAGLIARNEVPASPAAPVQAIVPAPSPPPAPAQTLGGSVAAASESKNEQGVVVTGSRLARGDFTAAAPTVAVDLGSAAKSSRLKDGNDESAASIVITGSRISASAARAARRGDWNICTVDDPARSLERCRRQIDQNAKGDLGRAAAHIGDGLAKAWAGDEDAAISAFDAAIEIRPKFAFAYLNRGMIYGRLGESERAIKDFDQAINYAPYDARAYYQRSVALRAIGKDARAVTDAQRAVSLDRQYEDLFD